MKHTEIEIDRQLETPVCKPENETQRVLRRALELLGPNGENWHGGGGEPSNHCEPDFDEKNNKWHYTFCPWGALRIVFHSNLNKSLPEDHPIVHFMEIAAQHFGFTSAERLSDAKGAVFSQVRAMFLRAIELAATP